MNIQDIIDLYREIEASTLNGMIKTMKKHIKDQEAEEIEWESWRTLQLKSLQDFRKKNASLVGAYDERTISNIETLLKGYYTEGALSQEREILENIVKGARVKPSKDIKKQLDNIKGDNTKEKVENVLALNGTFFNINNTQMKNLITEAINPIKAANKSYLRYSNKMYNDILTKTEIFAKGTGLTTHQAIDKASQEFIKNGICCVQYRMKDGSTRNVNICSYVEMCIRTNATRMKEEAAAEQRNKFGITTVVVSSYSNCSKLCKNYQGKVYYDDYFQKIEVPDDKYPRLSSAVGPTKLFHCNCKHSLRSFFPEVNSMPRQYDEKTTEENSSKVSKQRALERKVRAYENLKNNTLDPTTKRGYENKWIQAKNELNGFIKANSDVLRRDEWRESSVLNKYKKIEEIDALRKGNPTPIEKIIKEMELKKPVTERLKDKNITIEGRFGFDGEGNREYILEQIDDLSNRYNLTSPLTLRSRYDNGDTAAYHEHSRDMATNRINLNKRIFNNFEFLEAIEEACESKKWAVRVPKDQWRRKTIAHEFGHLVERELINQNFNLDASDPRFFDEYNKITKEIMKEFKELFEKEIGRPINMIDDLSVYACSNAKELFAEAMCLFECANEDNDVAKVMKLLLKKYNMLKD